MPSLSRTVLIIGTLTASMSLAQAGDKAAFNAPLRDAMPDITPLFAKAPEAQVDASAAVTPPVESKPAKGRQAKRLARARAAMKVEASLKHDAVARTEATASADAARGAPEASAAPSARPDAVPSADQVAKLESKSAGLGHDSAPLTSKSMPVVPAPASATTAAPAVSNTEAAFRTPGPTPTTTPGGPRERSSETVDELVTKHAVANGVPLKLAEAVVRIESRGNAHASNAGALGLMQIKFGTARAAGFSGPAVGLFVADTNLRYGMKILGDAYRAAGGNTCGALMRYQSGHLATHMNRANAIYCSRARAIMAGA